MGLMTHPCRECGEDRLFDQPHDEVEGDCPEWACTGCGAALIMGFPGLISGQISAAGQRPRQAA
jgi:hypothetical protein